MPQPRPIALTSGDLAGIGPDITLAVWQRHRREIAPFVMIVPPGSLAERAALLGHDVPIQTITDPADAMRVFPDALPVMTPSSGCQGPVTAGQATTANADTVIASIDDAVALVASGACSAIVTNPIAKHVLYEAGFRQPGHTEYLGVRAKAHADTVQPPWTRGDIRQPVMMLVSEPLKVVPVTIHIPLKDVIDQLSKDLIIETIETVAQTLRSDFLIDAPRIAVAGLNPHAGEAGTIGREDIDIVTPAIKAAKARGLNAFGPLPADTMFHAEARATYDAAVTMYHDQGLIPVKTLAFDTGVNTTLGLPFIRTSPDHGTAFDLAGSGRASPSSLLSAIQCAQYMVGNRTRSKAA